MELPKNMSFDEIIEKLPFLTFEEPLLYHIYASVNDLNEDETERIRKKIDDLKYKRDYIYESYKQKCIHTADFKEG